MSSPIVYCLISSISSGTQSSSII